MTSSSVRLKCFAKGAIKSLVLIVSLLLSSLSLEADIRACEELELMAVSPEAGVFACATPDKRQIFVCGHLEYDAETLGTEYFRDVKKGLDIAVPEHYFPNDDPDQTPIVNWRSHGQLFYSNWLNYYVYQATPYDLRDLK